MIWSTKVWKISIAIGWSDQTSESQSSWMVQFRRLQFWIDEFLGLPFSNIGLTSILSGISSSLPLLRLTECFFPQFDTHNQCVCILMNTKVNIICIKANIVNNEAVRITKFSWYLQNHLVYGPSFRLINKTVYSDKGMHWYTY